MITFILVVLACSVIGLVIFQCVLASQIEDLEFFQKDTVSLSFVENHLHDLYTKTKELQTVNAEIFGIIAKELGKEFKKVRVLENAGKYDEKVVTKFELVKATKTYK